MDPVVLMRMLIVGFLEGIGSERGIASRCADSLSIRRFLGYSLTEETPDYSTFTVFRRRLPVETFEALHAGVLRALRAHGLLRGRKLGVDSSVIVANASLSGLERRNSEESYRDWKAPLPDWTANKQSKRAAESPRRRSRSGLSAAQAPAEPTVPKQSS